MPLSASLRPSTDDALPVNAQNAKGLGRIVRKNRHDGALAGAGETRERQDLLARAAAQPLPYGLVGFELVRGQIVDGELAHWGILFRAASRRA